MFIFCRSLNNVLNEGKMNSWDKILYAFLLWKKIDRASILSSVFHLYACLDLLDILTWDSMNENVSGDKY